jgi:hypothetical protein
LSSVAPFTASIAAMYQDALLAHHRAPHNRRVIDSVNAHTEVVEKVMELRAKRLKREREELAFLQMDAQANGDEESMLRYGNMIFLSNQAQQLLDTNLQKFKNSLRE